MERAEISRDQIATAYNRIRPYVRKTPVIDCTGADFDIDAGQLTLKLEHLQHAGSFKSRGAFANLVLRDVPKAGVTAASGGNHGAAVAYAAAKLGRKATIFVPKISSPAKIQRIRDFGATLVVEGERYADAAAACEAYQKSPALSGSMPTIRPRHCSARVRSDWSSKPRHRTSTRCWSRSAAAD